MIEYIRNGQILEISKAYRTYCLRPTKFNKDNLQRQIVYFNSLAKKHGFDQLPSGTEANALHHKMVVLPNYNPDYKYSE